MDHIISEASAKNCIGWFFNPLSQVGSAVGSLTQAPPGQDTASRVGSKSQRYTTWNCISRTYVGGVTIAEAGEREADPPPAVDRREDLISSRLWAILVFVYYLIIAKILAIL